VVINDFQFRGIVMEKRYYPRIVKQFSAVVENVDGVHLEVLAVDASSEGICIQCNTTERDLITPGGSFVSNGKPVELFVWLDLPFEGGVAKKISARCHVAFSRRLSKDQCKIGMRYMEFEAGMQDTLLKYIESVNASNDMESIAL